ncbi:TIGR04141 family sporadically distributed protein [Photobacterium indicum]|uniref:TIGR04141 family sporadically distributed protein n=1 Tax=Photobacterium indicum TaxID=81447 RepID=UPI003D12F540
MSIEKPYITLKAFLSKPDIDCDDLETFLSSRTYQNFELSSNESLSGRLYVKNAEEKQPTWMPFINTGITGSLNLSNKSNSAVLFIEVDGRVVAYTFGYGRSMLDLDRFLPDFGMKTALNTLRHDSLKSVDIFTVDRSAVQKRTQAVRSSSVGDFGIDVSKDILRAVTGNPKENIPFQSVSGGDYVYSFGAYIEFDDLIETSRSLISYYTQESYKDQFSWVDNIRRLKNDTKKSELDEVLRGVIDAKDATNLAITAPEVVSWDKISGFSFTRSKSTIYPTLIIETYLKSLGDNSITLSTLKNHKLFIYDTDLNERCHSLYKSLYFEYVEANKTFILFSGDWFEIDNDFVVQLDRALAQIPISDLEFPTVHNWTHEDREKIETEGDYNERAATLKSYHLLDKKLIKSRTTTSAIELCDLMTDNKQLIHVKHKKGGSAGLSHLFAQGYVAAEVTISDKEFRKKARAKLRGIRADLDSLIPLNGIKSSDYEVVYLVLGDNNSTVKSALPFFSKINLVKAFENLTQKGFTVTICGVEKERIEPSTDSDESEA